MKKLILIFLLIPTVMMAQSSVGIQFETTAWADILAKAKKEKKYVFLDAYTTWCGPCKWMDKNVFPEASVGEFFNKNFVNAKIDMEKGEGIDIAKTYEIQAYPTYIFVDGDGKLVHRLVGSMPAESFITAAGEALNPETQYITLLTRYENGERDPEFVYKLAYAARKAYDAKNQDKFFNEYINSQKDWLTEANVKFISDFLSDPTHPTFEFVRKNREVFEKAMGKERYESTLYFNVYRGAFMSMGGRPAPEQAEEYIQKANDYFKKMLPEYYDRLSNSFKMDVYRATKLWDNYAATGFTYFQNNDNANFNELNSFAWTVFENIEDKEILTKALDIALRSVKLTEGSHNTDTVANLYAKLGDKAKAKEYALRSIELAKANGEDYSSTQKLLDSL